MKSHGSFWVVTMWCEIHTDNVLRCFMDAKGLNYGDLLVGLVPELMS
jgi:hypothetical protein